MSVRFTSLEDFRLVLQNWKTARPNDDVRWNAPVEIRREVRDELIEALTPVSEDEVIESHTETVEMKGSWSNGVTVGGSDNTVPYPTMQAPPDNRYLRHEAMTMALASFGGLNIDSDRLLRRAKEIETYLSGADQPTIHKFNHRPGKAYLLTEAEWKVYCTLTQEQGETFLSWKEANG